MNDGSSVGFATVNLRIDGCGLQIVCEDPEIAEVVRFRLADVVADGSAPHAFTIQAPTSGSKLHVLMDRSGFVLARTRSAEECVSILVDHLGAWLQPPPGTVRLKARAFLQTESSRVALAVLPLFIDPPPVERRLESIRWRLIDRHVVDVARDGRIQVSASPWVDAGGTEILGHAGVPEGPLAVDRLLVPVTHGTGPSSAAVVALLAGSMSVGTGLSRRVETAAQMVTSSLVVSVDLTDRGSRYRALEV